jgi:hypothetical protein
MWVFSTPLNGELLDDAAVGERVQAEPAVLGGDRAAQEAHLPHARDEVLRVGIGMLELGGDR